MDDSSRLAVLGLIAMGEEEVTKESQNQEEEEEKSENQSNTNQSI